MNRACRHGYHQCRGRRTREVRGDRPPEAPICRFTAPPDLPRDRADALRAAFDATMKDPDYLAEANQRRLDINPMSGAAINKLIAELYATPPDVIAATKTAISEGVK
jgi:hypothetical protein